MSGHTRYIQDSKYGQKNSTHQHLLTLFVKLTSNDSERPDLVRNDNKHCNGEMAGGKQIKVSSLREEKGKKQKQIPTLKNIEGLISFINAE